MAHTVNPIGHWKELEKWLSAVTVSLLLKATNNLRDQSRQQLDDHKREAMVQSPIQSYSHKATSYH